MKATHTQTLPEVAIDCRHKLSKLDLQWRSACYPMDISSQDARRIEQAAHEQTRSIESKSRRRHAMRAIRRAAIAKVRGGAK